MNDIIASILELWGMARFSQFSSIMYDELLYLVPFWIMLLLPIFTCILYYKITDAVPGASVGRWLLYGAGGGLLVFIINFLYLNNKNSRLQLEFTFADMFAFLLITFLWAMVIYFVFSLIMKRFSVNRQFIPF